MVSIKRLSFISTDADADNNDRNEKLSMARWSYLSQLKVMK